MNISCELHKQTVHATLTKLHMRQWNWMLQARGALVLANEVCGVPDKPNDAHAVIAISLPGRGEEERGRVVIRITVHLT